MLEVSCTGVLRSLGELDNLIEMEVAMSGKGYAFSGQPPGETRVAPLCAIRVA